MNRIINIAYTFLGNITAALIKWLILILIVRLMNPEAVGFYTFAIALTSPIMLFSNMRLRTRYIVENIDFNDLMKIRYILDVISMIIIFVTTYLFMNDYIYIVILIALTKALDLSSELYYGILQKKENFKLIGMMMVGKNIGIIIVFACILISTKNLYFSLIGQIFIQFIWLILVERKALKYTVKATSQELKSKKKLFIMFLTGLPLGVVQLLNSYNILIPRYLIENFLSLKDVGIFASISYLLTIMDLFMNAISQNFITSIKESVNKNEIKKLKKFMNKHVLMSSLMLGIVTFTATYLFGEKVIYLLYGNDYAKESAILVVISLSIIFNFQSWMFDSTLMALKVYNAQLIISFITLIVSVVSSVILISIYGLIGAAISVVIITMIQACVKYIIVNIKIKKLGY
ncbi:oligosaccharide flippase family protein [Staphylococcus ureilyticus]